MTTSRRGIAAHRLRILLVFTVTTGLAWASTTQAQYSTLQAPDTQLVLQGSDGYQDIHVGSVVPQVPDPSILPAPQDGAPVSGLQQQQPDDDLDVLMRGPLHEAFAAAHQADAKPSPLVPRVPPETVEEVPPEYKPDGNNVQWIPGYWGWDDSQSDFIWVSGVWRDVPPGRQWVPGYWEPEDGGARWISGFWAEQTQQGVNYLPAPPSSIDSGPSVASPGDNYFYVPGNWQYYNGNYRWLSGQWQPSVANWIWIPAQFIWTPRGCLYQSGYWDYDVAYRGTCFAPVRFRRPVYTAGFYRYRPSFVVNIGFNFLTHLFVRPGCGQYYYGDWYGSNFYNIGFRPWVSYSSHYRHYDPLLAFYRCQRYPNNRNLNVVQYLASQHQIYANNQNYRPRPTLAGQINFANHSGGLNNRDFVQRANYVRSFDSVLQQNHGSFSGNSGRGNGPSRSDVASHASFKKLNDSDKAKVHQQVDYQSQLQKQRQQQEVRDALIQSKRTGQHPGNNFNRLQFPVSKSDAKPVASTGGNKNTGKQPTTRFIDQSSLADLNRAVQKARNDAAADKRKQDQTRINRLQQFQNSNNGKGIRETAHTQLNPVRQQLENRVQSKSSGSPATFNPSNRSRPVQKSNNLSTEKSTVNFQNRIPSSGNNVTTRMPSTKGAVHSAFPNRTSGFNSSSNSGNRTFGSSSTYNSTPSFNRSSTTHFGAQHSSNFGSGSGNTGGRSHGGGGHGKR